VRANPDDRVVIDEVPIGGHVGPSTGSVIAGCLTAAWNVVAEFLRIRGNSKLIIVVRRISCSWARCSRSSSCATVNDYFPNRKCMPIGNFSSLIHDAMSSQGRISALPPTWRTSVDVWSLDTWSRIGGNASQRNQSHVNTRHEVLDWFGPSRRVIALRPVLMYYAIEIGSSLFLSESLGVFRGFLGCPRCESILSIYSWGTVS
jgi:hypothetical protein